MSSPAGLPDLSNVVVIRVPDDCGTWSVDLNETLVLYFTQNINFQCDHPEYFNPPLKLGLHAARTLSSPSKPTPQSNGKNINYTHPGTPDHCPTNGGQAGAHTLTAGHVIHIGSDPLVLFALIRDAENTDGTLRDAWPNTKIFVNFLLSQNSPAIPDTAKTFLEELKAAGEEAYDVTLSSSNDITSKSAK